ncbi:MAG: hypothetical protein N2117_15230 [Anaerolineales bacterium]|nr:hypothetical protein [Anaerolineales bacterium]MCX7756580.1 hypothetical protein [Anaerolineales bacterium]MDW8278630.1 hypothetical protein [Anaerolineales bacterium]
MGFTIERKREIHRRRHRKAKVAKLKAKYLAATSKAEKERIAAKLKRISFYVELPASK